MKQPLMTALCLLASLSIPADASSKFCQFSTDPDGVVAGAAYDVSAAYQAADSVVVGRVGARGRTGVQPIAVSRIVKSPNAAGLSYVGQPASERPVYEGMRLPPERDFVLLLRMKKTGVYGSVDGDGAACPTVFPVKDGYARVGNQAVALDNLERFFDSKPEAIAYP